MKFERIEKVVIVAAVSLALFSIGGRLAALLVFGY